MATQNVPGMYSPFSAVVNTSPSVSFYANLLARKQAKEDALDEYYRRLPSTINEQGVRDQERPVITQQMNDAMKYWMENRDAIRNPRLDKGASQLEYENRIRQVKGIVDESKQRGKTGLEVGKMRLEGKNPHIFEDQGIVDAISAHDLPVGAEGSKGLDLSTLAVPPKPFGAKEYGVLSKEAIGDLKLKPKYEEGKARTDRKTGQVFIPYSESYTPESIQVASEKFGNLADEDISAKNHYTKLMHDPKFYEQADAAYKSVYGKDAIVDSPKKAAIADHIINMRGVVNEGETLRADSELAFQRAQQNIRLNKSYGGFSSAVPPPKDGENYDLTERLQGIKITGLTTGKSFGVKPDTKILYNPTTKLITYTDINGDTKSKTREEFKKDISTINTAQDLKIVDEAFNSMETPETQQKNSTYKIKGKVYTQKQLHDMGYTDEQVKQFKL